MSETVHFFLELLKITIPALVVFATAYYLVKKHLDTSITLRQMDIKQSAVNATTPMKMQAYERLAMFCERSEISSLLGRFYDSEMQCKELLFMMVGAIKQEYEHNISQQVYVSENLWNIIKLARNQNIAILESIGSKVGLDASASELYAAVQAHLAEHPENPLLVAQSAIRQEASLSL